MSLCDRMKTGATTHSRDPGSRCPIGTNQASLALLATLAVGAKGCVLVALDAQLAAGGSDVAGWPGPGIAQTGSAKGFMDPAGQRPVTQEALDVDMPHAGQVVPSSFKALTKKDGSKHARGSRRAMTATDTARSTSSPPHNVLHRSGNRSRHCSYIRVGDGKLA